MPSGESSATRPPLYRTPEPRSVPGAWFDQEAVDRVVEFARFCRHTKGRRWANKPIEFEPWQIEHIIAPVFGWKHPDGRRIIRTVWIETPKKQGKSTIAAVVGLYLAGPDGEPGAEVYAAAAAKEQARLVFDPARQMVERSPALRKRYRAIRNRIVYRRSEGFFGVISADAAVQEGPNVHGAIIDEVHVHRSRDLIDTLEDGTIARDQPLVFFITTAGEEGDESIYAEKHDYCIAVANGLIVDPSFFGVIYAAEPGDDWRSEETWRKAMPNLGVTVMPEEIASKAIAAEASPGKLNTFLRKYLNLRTRQTIRWHSLDVWDASRGTVREKDLEGELCYGGLSIARSQDIGSFVLDFPQPDGSHKVLWRFWLPEALLGALDERTASMASRWVRSGKLRLTTGDVIDYKAIRKAIMADDGRFRVAEIALNRRGATQLAQDLAENFLDLVEMTPGITLAPATQEWERLLLGRTYHHGGHPIARWMFDGLQVKQDAEGNVWPDQGKSRSNISGLVAAVMALDRTIRGAGEVDLAGQVW